MDKVRIGVIGLGNMGGCHARNIGGIRNAVLTAVCDIDRPKADAFARELSVKPFYAADEMLDSGLVDGIIIATPHYSHTTIGIAAFRKNLHVLVEKPISVHKADCERLIAAHEKNKQKVFSAMFMQRTDPHYYKIRDLIRDGELGGITRVTWICTDWFRSNAYYRSSAWRATWKGEGGGILLNQCPHNLDLLQWILGMMPVRIRAACALGKWHPIEVEDDVTAYLEYPNGATGTFIASTGEAPGVNLLAISGDRGCVRLEHGRIHFTRNVMATSRFNKTTSGCFSSPERWEIEIPVSGNGGQHNEIIQNFVNAILHGETLKAPAEEGIRSVELANAMLYSSLTGKTIELPLNASAYEKTLKGLIANSRGRKKTVRPSAPVDMRKSFR